ncbi:OmpA family protein [Flavobacterium algoritolerans]|uniref:OmpA family protein n=1 Tax=Flavobacterium algoritolerans TaxID=3041254 RepID=A0ABT6VB73_9FLAO|nr:OmpA family protein [Flavobacterium algoritolerans]MDI5895449.1 OmpA family protein [Flavobacterium algoritolerans]
MKLSSKYFSYCAILLLFTLYGFSQNKSVVNADKKFDDYSFVDAIATYEKVADKGYKDEKMFQKLGDSYYFIADLVKAQKWYTELFDLNEVQETEYYYRYSQSLKAIGNYAKADKMLEKFITKSYNDQRGKLFANQRNYLEDIKTNSGRYEIADAGVNSEYSDYGSSFYNKNLLFASARDIGGVSKKVFKWNNESFTNLYLSEIKSDADMGKPKLFSSSINTKFHESTPVFTNDGNTMYFTRNNYLDGKKQKNARKVTLLKLYKATKVDEKWVNVQELPFNSNEYSVAHPTLSLDEKNLYFASDMPGTNGLSDLFTVTINADGTFGKPQNLGFPINTEARETFPFISQENKLYFASDGHPGLGGLDIFVVNLTVNSEKKTIKNIGAPINSAKDDFAFLIDSKNHKGFFTSNRDGGNGSDDIYKFTELPKPICTQILKGKITDQDSGAILSNSKVSLFDEKFNLIKEMTTTADGLYTFDVVCERIYYLRAQNQDYETEEVQVTVAQTSGETIRPVTLQKIKKIILVGTDLAKTLSIPMLYFDLNKSFIRKDAAFELEKILVVLKEYPTMKIDIRSHTDSRQTNKYNESLSDRRAQATRAWLIANGITTDRLTSKGYGETRLINKCSNNVPCTEEEHQANRRSEFIITSI